MARLSGYHPGQLDQLVTFQRQASPATSFEARQWVDLVQAWARVGSARSAEPSLADQVQQVVTHTVTVRLIAELAVAEDSAQWRIVYTDRVTGVSHTLAVVGPGRAVNSMYLNFSCNEGLADGH